MPRRLSRVLAAVAILVAAAAAWFFLAPPQAGGGTSYAVIYGTSMEPHFHRGNLVVLRRRASYDIGDIVGYRSQQLHRSVLHRIVAVHDGRYTFKGDNNTFLDPEHPRAAQLFGEEWLTVPAAGTLLEWVHTPRNAALLTGIAAMLLLLSGGVELQHRRRGRAPSAAAPEGGAHVRAPLDAGVLAFGAVALAGSLALGFAAFARPLDRTAVVSDMYVQKGRFDYRARAPVGAVYQRPVLRAPDPVFRKLVRRLDVRFAYATTARAAAHLSGLGRLDAVLTDDRGWRHRFVLEPARSFTDGRALLHGTVDLRALSRVLHAFETQTGTQSALYKLEILPFVQLHGTVAGRPVRDSFAPSLRLDVDDLRLQLEAPSTGASSLNTLSRAKAGAGTRSEPLVLGAFGRSTTVAAARRYALLGGSGATAVFLLGLWLLARTRRGDEVAAIRRRYRDWIVEVAPGNRRAGAARRVATMDALARIAERYGRMILHESRDGHDAFVIEDDGVVYVYEPQGSPAAVVSIGRTFPAEVGAAREGEG